MKINLHVEINQIVIFKHTNGRFMISLMAAVHDEYFLFPNGTVGRRPPDPSYVTKGSESFASLESAFDFLVSWLKSDPSE